MKETLKKLTPYHGYYDYWKSEVKKLEKKDITIIISDLDYTIFSRDEQLEKEEILRNNRGSDGNLVIINEIGINIYYQKYYKGKSFPTDIIDKMNPETDVIITTGSRELQMAKVSGTAIEKFKLIATDTPQDKIIETIRYIIFDLKYIPSKITVYEDRPQYYIKYKDLIEDVLSCVLKIVQVEMDGNKGYKKLD